MITNKLKMFFLLLLGVGIFYTSSKSQVEQSSPQLTTKTQTYSITGKTVDENNMPVVDVRVYAMLNDRPAKARILMSFTDRNGNFSLGVSEPGLYNVYTAKDIDGYADTLNGTVATSSAPQISIDEVNPKANVDIKLGAKSPRLKGKVVDSQTSKQITDARLKLCSIEKADLCFSTSINADGTFDLLVPLKPFTITASSPRYRESKFTQKGANNKMEESLSLKSGQTQEITISLDLN